MTLEIVTNTKEVILSRTGMRADCCVKEKVGIWPILEFEIWAFEGTVYVQLYSMCGFVGSIQNFVKISKRKTVFDFEQ